MQIVYALESVPEKVTRSIFLAGPTPRDSDGKPWRQDAIKILEDIGFEDGTVFVPEPRDKNWHREYDRQVEWEEECLNAADVILFWVPRNLETMPGFTTNIEWGRWESSGKLVLGYPEDAEKMSYMQHYCDKLNISVSDTLTDTIKAALAFIGKGVERTGGERFVPLYIWNTPQFQNWYQTQVKAGNRLDDARVLYTFRPGNKKFVFLMALHVNVYIASEDRNKTNELVISRTDISSIVLWRRQESLSNSEIVLVREFRSPARTADGFIRELPGGSSAKPGEDPLQVAAEEVHEETGFYLDASRLEAVSAKQLAGTLSSHKSNLFMAELTEEEMRWFHSQKDIPHGNIEDSEMTFIEVVTVEQLLSHEVEVDWSTLGMILSVVSK